MTDLMALRRKMERYRHRVDREANALKESYLALERLHDFYGSLNSKDRLLADQILGEWVLSDDENVRFDAMSLVDDFSIVTALPALKELVHRLSASVAPSAPYELNKVSRVIGDLIAARSHPPPEQ